MEKKEERFVAHSHTCTVQYRTYLYLMERKTWRGRPADFSWKIFRDHYIPSGATCLVL